ncbi:hypothetical protein IAQ61_007968 [Plenodomus lingam]|uniref:uncharacterized protein n=1 Tax=Leptosphaeria maculans TaxID=5022 RepID=UPI0033182757|nr:hypothetical protein IAQ61_007968 [Plenodomus lingam]
MYAALNPNEDKNKCWFCKENHPSQQQTCKCGAQTIPTQDKNGKLNYRIYSFGSNVEYFPSSHRIRGNLLETVVQLLKDSVLMAVRVGCRSQSAIMIRDADGSLRSCTTASKHTLRENISIPEFLQASREILASHADRTAGKALSSLHDDCLHSPLVLGSSWWHV